MTSTTPPVISVTEELLAELEEVAGNATPGRWDAGGSPVGDFIVTGPIGQWICGAIDPGHDADFIAAANPATVLALIARIRELEKDAARYRWLRNPDQDVALVIDKKTGHVPVDELGFGGYGIYEYRAGDELDAAIDAAMPSPPKEGV